MSGPSKGHSRRFESVYGHLATDGMQVQCHVCGKWYRNVALHASRTHDMSPTQYRDEFGLLSSVTLISPDLAERKAEIANRIADENETVQRVLRGEFRPPPGSTRPPMRPLSKRVNIAKQRENAAEYWRKKLAAQGWSSWHDAVAWANENERGWTDLEKKLDVGGDAMREQCRRAGAEITVDANVLRQRELAAAYWQPILAAAGFATWQDACDWASARGAAWDAIATKLGTPGKNVWRPATRAGTTLERPTPEVLTLAREYHREHGDLNVPTNSELGGMLSKMRDKYRPTTSGRFSQTSTSSIRTGSSRPPPAPPSPGARRRQRRFGRCPIGSAIMAGNPGSTPPCGRQ